MADTEETTPPGTRSGRAAALIEAALFEIKKVIVGQDEVVEQVLVCLLAHGHCLLEGVPGLAKTLTVETLAEVVSGSFARIQFTPDLVPADIVGTRIYHASQGHFEVEHGPVFANFVLADEINRAPAKVQSALLEVMAERQVTIGDQTFTVPSPFLVLGTQNPIESEGVYMLPEAQQDRFLMKIIVDYPAEREEVEIVRRMGGPAPHADAVLSPRHLVQLQKATQEVYLDPAIIEYAVQLVTATRDPAKHGLTDLDELVSHGVSPRASLGLARAARARALLRGRNYVLPTDIRAAAMPVFRHRLVLSYEAIATEVSADEVIRSLVDRIPEPTTAPQQGTSGAAPAS